MTNLLLADSIINEFDRLGVSTNQNECSGLMADDANIVAEIQAVKIYDDYDSGIYDGEQVLSILKSLEGATLDAGDEIINIWSAIAEALI